MTRTSMQALAFATLTCAFAVALCGAHGAADVVQDHAVSSTSGSSDGLVASEWIYRWHRGGAWMFHDSVHPCFAGSNSSCAIRFTAPADRAVALRVNTTIVAHLASVRVSYDLGARAAADGDFLAMYLVDEEEPTRSASGAAANDLLTDFIDYAFVPTLNGSTGSVVFGPLVNMRSSYQFRYIRRIHPLKYEYEVATESPYVEMERGHSEPLHVRLALTDKPNEMRVMWTSGRASHVHVHYGAKSPANATARHAAATTTASYRATDMCNAPATTVSASYYRHPGFMHDAVMDSLEPGTTYYYRVGSRNGVTSDLFAFTFPPVAGSKPHTPNGSDDRQSFIVFGDLGPNVVVPADGARERRYAPRDYTSRPAKPTAVNTVMRRIEQDLIDDDDSRTSRYAAVVHVGDLSYAKGRTFVWDQFSAVVQPVAARIPYMVAIGNHEYGYEANGSHYDPSGVTSAWRPAGGNYGDDSHGECGVPTATRFHMPATGNSVFWYNFTVGLTHHIVLSSEHDCGAHAPMREWLERVLASVDRTLTPWLFVHIHRPLYCSERYDSDAAVASLLRDCFERLFMTHRVDVVFAGHYHAYERTCPVYQSQCRHKRLASGEELALATVHVMVGSGGAALDDVDYDVSAHHWSANRQQTYGHARLHVYNATHAQLEFVRARDRDVTDAKWLISTHDWTYQRGE